ncbi:hypothetical protein [uncultured Endozoicomonas sp.]|uniref:hypothetical protein n=1 Tax=uncultured Endozoicomonas sp. TaxID=432652 RepID=UPI002616A2F8|nr:hypothetical protein [uncultured Endozoicomonas sp.]
MKTFKTLALATAVSAGLLGASGVMAATDGLLQPNSSQGEFDITLDLSTVIQISKLNDIPLTYTNGDATGGMDFCVYTNNTNSKYQITASGSYNDGSAQTGFSLGKGDADIINYDLHFTDAISVDSNVPKLTSGTVSNNSGSGWQGSGTLDCGSSENASIFVKTTTDFNSFDGSYSSTVTLLVEPV